MIHKIDKLIKEVPLYKSLSSIEATEIASNIENLNYPILEKKHIIDGFPGNWMTESLHHAIKEGRIETTTTSGTSGQRIQIFRKKDWWVDEYIRTYKYSKHLKDFKIGINKKAILTTAICSNTSCQLGTLSYQERITLNTLYLNSSHDPNHWNKFDIERMLDELNEFKPEYLDADPIYLALFLKKVDEYNLSAKLYFPKLITLSYELVTIFSKRFIEKWMNKCVLCNFYGTTELGYIYIEEDGRWIRTSDLSKVEFSPLCKEKGLFYLIITSIKNEFMPFIRFKVGDIVKINSSGEYINFDDDTQIDYFCGREKDITYNSKGEPITPGELDRFLGETENFLLHYQIQINNKSKFLFRYITTNNAPLLEAQQNEIKLILMKLFGNLLELRFKHERSISPEVSGKFSTIKQMS